jgi:D-aspartate ligase
VRRPSSPRRGPAFSRGLPPAVLIGLDCITGLQSARILSARGVPVVGVAANPQHFCSRTNACVEKIFVDTSSPALIDALEDLSTRLPGNPVLICCTDPSVRLVSRHRERLESTYRLVLADADVVHTLMDKARFAAWAQSRGYPTPTTAKVVDRDSAIHVAAHLRFPCVAKPTLKSPAWDTVTSDKAVALRSPEAWLAFHTACGDDVGPLIVQEWVPGPDANLFSCNAYFDASGQPLATFVARKLRQWPPERGTSCLGEEVRCDEVLDTTLRLFSEFGHRGLAYLEMKKHERTGELLIIEPNVGRPTGRSAIAEAGGVELLATAYCDAAGLPPPTARTQRYTGAKWIYARHDLQSAVYYLRRGELSLGEWFQSLRGSKVDAVWSWRDPLPFVGDLQRAARLAVMAAGRRAPRAARAPVIARVPAAD